MTRTQRSPRLGLSMLVTLPLLAAHASLSPALPAVDSGDRPNVVWIVADDLSPALGCYGDAFATTPNLDRFAKDSVLYTHAFATAPVCSPSRACLINGLYAPTQGTHNMRSTFPIPDRMTGFPSFLRAAGYYTTNNVKTDYNSANWREIIAASWDESSADAHWRDRPAGKPFFSIFNLMTTHQSRAMVWPYEQFVRDVQARLTPQEIHDPAKVPVPPYYPDSPAIRKTLARLYDCVTVMDKEVGAILKQLKEDGLADDTIVVFYSDHGSGMPRHKRTLLDTGLRVPMLVRFPKKWQHLAPGEPGSTTDRLVCFEDFGPTVLSLAGVAIPDYMGGQAFLGKEQTEPRRYVFGHRDRVDEVIDMARSVRGQRYLYIHNFMPHLGYNQPSAWPDQGEIDQEIFRLTDRTKMTAAQWHFAGPTRPVEELYDCDADPLNLTNLASSPEHRADLQRMRKALADELMATRDLGFIPEAMMWERIADGRTPMEVGRSLDEGDRAAVMEAASLVGVGAEKQFIAYLRSTDAAVRYWGAVGLSAAPPITDDAADALLPALDDASADVRIEAATALVRHGRSDRAVAVLAGSLDEANLAAVLHAARAIELLGDKAKAAAQAMRRTDARLKKLRPQEVPATVVQPGDLDMAMFIGFSTQAFLARQDALAGASDRDAASGGPIAGQGVMVGEVTPTSALAQVRLTRSDKLIDRDVPGVPGVVEFALSPGQGSPQVVHATAERDFIARAQFTDLKPGTPYTCTTRIGPDADHLTPGPKATFKTLPGADAAVNVRFVVVTGMNYAKFHGDNRIDRAQHLIENNTALPAPYAGPDKHLGYPALQTILKLRPDFFVGTGDNVYYDTPDNPRAKTIPELRRKWHEQFVQPRYRDLFAAVPTYWMIDDHDYRVDDCDNTGDYDPTPQVGRRMMLEQLPVADHADADAKTYRTHRVGRDLQVWFPEGRMYRSPNTMPDGPGKSIWGDEQKAWLKRSLAASDATFKLLISPTPLIGPDDLRKTDNHTDAGGFRHERDEFFAWLHGTGIDKKHFYIVCGDRHWQYHSIDPSGMEEFSCGALVDANSRPARRPGDPKGTDPKGLIRQVYTQDPPSGGFLMIEVTPAAGDQPPTLTFNFHDERGKLLYQHKKRGD